MFEKIKKTLPNCPDDVIEQWIRPHAEGRGWPPSPTNDWKYLLGLDVPLDILSKVHWEKEKIKISPDMLSHASQQALMVVCTKHYGINGGNDRVNSCFAYIQKHGVFPKPIIFYQKNEELFTWDGSHRMTAYFQLSGLLPRLDGGKRKANVQEVQEMWIARDNQ